LNKNVFASVGAPHSWNHLLKFFSWFVKILRMTTPVDKPPGEPKEAETL